jgi:hypothetical protein
MKCPDCSPESFQDPDMEVFALRPTCQTCLGKGMVSSQLERWKELAAKIRDFRESRGWTFGDLAAALNDIAVRIQKPGTTAGVVERVEFCHGSPYKILDYIERLKVFEKTGTVPMMADPP